MSEIDRAKALAILSALEKRQTQEEAQQKFLKFVDCMWEGFIHGRHFEIMSNAFERIAKGELTRLIINMPPRHGKSEMASYLLPAWFLGLYPDKKIMQFSHSSELAETFGRKVRNLVDSDKYHEIFPETKLSKDSTAAARWNTNKGGEYHALGFGTNAAGKGSHLCCVKGTLVQVKGKGWVPIESVHIGELVYGRLGFSYVQKTMVSEVNQRTRINNTYDVTPNHPVWVKSKGFIAAADVKAGDILQTTSLWDKIKLSILSRTA
jgi:hypothetical protein